MSNAFTPSPLPGNHWQPCGAQYVAVYGTLRAGGVNDIRRLRPSIVCLGTTLVTGTLHDLGWYPGLSLSGVQPVLAEIYPLDDELELALDRIEGLWPTDMGEYAKRLLTLPVTASITAPEAHAQVQQELQVLLYEALPQALRNTPVIHSSDWLSWFSHQNRPVPEQKFQLRSATDNG